MTSTQLPDRLVFFTTDPGYLVPTLVAAEQVARQCVAVGVADVAVFLVGFGADVADALQREFPELRFHRLDPEQFELPTGAVYNATHVPRSALARLVVGRHIGSQYEHLIYMDGDIQVVGDLAPLLRFDVPVGRLLAAPDLAELVWREWGKFASGFRRYARQLGVRKPQEYFNSGVLAARRATWLEIGQLAFDFMSASSGRCRFHDQSALNHVARLARLRLSPRYNFLSAYQQLLDEPSDFAAVLHFSGGEKPWRDPFGGEAGSPFLSTYNDFVDRHELLRSFWEQTPGRRRPGLRSTSFPRRLVALWRVKSRRLRFHRLLLSTDYALK